MRKSQITLLIITDRKKWHYLAVKRLCTLLRAIRPGRNGDFYCLKCFQSHRTENKL